MAKYTDRIETVIEPCKDGSGNWYWSIRIEGDLYADGEAESQDAANIRITVNLDQWKQQNA